MNDANAIEEDYVETSDVEELSELYRIPAEEPPASARIMTPERSPRVEGSDRKRRKLSHTTYEAQISPGRGPSTRTLHDILPLTGASHANLKDVDIIQAPVGNEVKMEVDKQLGSESLDHLDASRHESSPLNESPPLNELPPQIKSPPRNESPPQRKSPPQNESLPQHELSPQNESIPQHELPHETDDDDEPLNHFAYPTSSQLVTPKADLARERQPPVELYFNQEDSEDELDSIRPEISLPLSTPVELARTPEISSHKDDDTSNVLLSSPLSSVGDEDQVGPAASQRGSASSRNATTVGMANVEEDEALTRYPLRRRQPNQLHPYRFDEYVYKKNLKGNPAAIIDVLHLRRRRGNQAEDHYEEDDYEEEDTQSTQQQTVPGEVQQERMNSPLAPGLLGLVDPLSDSESGSDDLAAEARRIDRDMRRRKKEEEARQKEAREEERRERERLKAARQAQRKPKRFPALEVPNHRNGPMAQNHEIRTINSPRQAQSRAPSSPNSSSPAPTAPTNDANEREETNERDNEFQALREYFMDDFAMASEGLESRTVASEPPPSVKSVEAEEISSSSPVQDNDGGSSSDSDHDNLPSGDDRRYRELFKLYPPGMARVLLKGNNQQRSRRRDAESPVEGPLLPGQSRIRRAANPKDAKDIRGDSESDESDAERRSRPSTPSSNDYIHGHMDYDMNNSPQTQAQEVRRIRTQGRPPSVVEISDDESSSHSSEEEVVDEDDLKTLLGDDDAGIIYDSGPGHNVVKEESMIDWMLSRTRIVGSTISKPKTAKRRRDPLNKSSNRGGNSRSLQSKFKIDVTTRGAHRLGKERQTLLSFANHTSAGNSNSSSNKEQVRMAPNAIVVEVQGMERKSWKERRKERRERAKRQGVYSMANPHTAGITSGKSKKLMKVTFDLDDDDFYRSFAPQHQPAELGVINKGKSAPLIPDKQSYDSLDQQESPQAKRKSRPRLKRRGDPVHRCTVDMGIETLQPGVTFNSESLLREGHLHVFLDTLTSDSSPCRPDPTYLCYININSSMDPEVFLQESERVFDGLLAFASEIPSDGYEEKAKDWNTLIRSTCRHISWFYHHSCGESRDRISSSVKKTIFSITSKLVDIPPDSLNITILSLCWFCIEASIRSGHRYGSSPLPEVCPTHTSVRLLIQHLVGYGLRKPYEAAKKSQVLNDTETACYAAEMWICLLHILLAYDGQSPDGTKRENSLWMEVLLYYQRLPPTNTFDFAENLWETLFALMALSQFSPFGIVVSESHLFPSWAVVARAVKQVQLAHGDKIQDMAPTTLEQRDGYFYIVISRCYHLLDHWKWKMDHSFGTLTQLIDVFRARNFVNLHGEKADYPDFMLDGDWSLLSQLHPSKDSGFTLILKLLMRAIECKCLSVAEIRKMVSLIIPVSKFKIQEKIPGVDDLSPICNRFAALALVISVDSTSAARIVKQVQKSIDFQASDPTTQLLTIRGIKLLMSLLIQRNICLQEVQIWFDTIITSVASQFKVLCSPEPAILDKQMHNAKIRDYSLLVLSLYATGRATMETFATKAQYPDTAILLAFKPFLEPECRKLIEDANCNMVEMRRFIESFLNARCKLLPLPPEPNLPAVQVDDPESQDYDFDIDFNDPTTLALLDGEENNLVSIKEKEAAVNLVHDVVFPLYWAAQRKIKRFCDSATRFVVEHDLWRTLDSWSRCLVGCMHIIIQHNALHNWDFCLTEVTQLWTRIHIDWLKTRIKLVVYLEILRHDPSFYTSRKSDYLFLLFESFAIHDLTIEPTFWRRIILHEHNSNALFKDTAPVLVSFEDGGSLDGQGFRNTLLQVLFANIETGLQDNTPDSTSQVELCLKFLSAVRGIFQDLTRQSQDGTEYHAWCKDVVTLFGKYPRLRYHQRLSSIMDLIISRL